jgi:hypothetical protein
MLILTMIEGQVFAANAPSEKEAHRTGAWENVSVAPDTAAAYKKRKKWPMEFILYYHIGQDDMGMALVRAGQVVERLRFRGLQKELREQHRNSG